MNAEPQEVNKFYKNLQASPPKSLSQLMHFPSMAKVAEAIRKQNRTKQELNITDSIYDSVLANIMKIADMYLGLDSVMIRAYNKIKHTFPLLDTPYWTRSRKSNELGVLVEDENIPSGTFGTFPPKIDQKDVNFEITGIAHVTEIGVEIMAIYLQLHELSLLKS